MITNLRVANKFGEVQNSKAAWESIEQKKRRTLSQQLVTVRHAPVSAWLKKSKLKTKYQNAICLHNYDQVSPSDVSRTHTLTAHAASKSEHILIMED